MKIFICPRYSFKRSVIINNKLNCIINHQQLRTGPWNVKAEDELAKRPELKQEDLETLKNWISSQAHLPQNIDDEMLLHFLHAGYFNVDNTKETIELFYTYRSSMTEFFTDWDPLSKDIQQMVNNILIAAPLPGYDKDGNKIIVCRLNETDAANFVYPISVKWLMITAQIAQWDLGIQDGYVIVYDATGFSMSHLMKCSLSNVRNYINWGEKASPIRVVKLVIVNTSSVVKKMMTLVKPFLCKELVNMMKFHTDTDPYFNTLEKCTVPEDYGGTAAPLLTLHRQNIKQVTEHRNHLMEEVKMKSDESKRLKNSKKAIKQAEKSLQQLEID